MEKLGFLYVAKNAERWGDQRWRSGTEPKETVERRREMVEREGRCGLEVMAPKIFGCEKGQNWVNCALFMDSSADGNNIIIKL